MPGREKVTKKDGRRLVTLAAYARLRKKKGLKGATRTAVYRALEKGWIEKTPEGLIDVDVADRCWAHHSRSRIDDPTPTAPPPGSPFVQAAKAAKTKTAKDHQDIYNEERARREKAKAALAELEAAERKGELVRRAAVTKAWFDATRATRDRLLGLPDRLATQLAAIDDVHSVRELLRSEITDALTNLAAESKLS